MTSTSDRIIGEIRRAESHQQLEEIFSIEGPRAMKYVDGSYATTDQLPARRMVLDLDKNEYVFEDFFLDEDLPAAMLRQAYKRAGISMTWIREAGKPDREVSSDAVYYVWTDFAQRKAKALPWWKRLLRRIGPLPRSS
jgi:hypothetical protein